MAFITQFSTSNNRPARPCARPLCRRIALLLAWLLSLPLATADAAGFDIGQAEVHWDWGRAEYLLNAQIDYAFSREVLQALENGVPLTLVLDIRVQRLHKWWANETRETQQLRHQLTYHAFSGQYLLRNLNSSELQIYPSLHAVLGDLGQLTDLPLPETAKINNTSKYRILLRTYLDVEALPTPLRPVAYVSPAWRLDSGWQTCRLQP